MSYYGSEFVESTSSIERLKKYPAKLSAKSLVNSKTGPHEFTVMDLKQFEYILLVDLQSALLVTFLF